MTALLLPGKKDVWQESRAFVADSHHTEVMGRSLDHLIDRRMRMKRFALLVALSVLAVLVPMGPASATHVTLQPNEYKQFTLVGNCVVGLQHGTVYGVAYSKIRIISGCTAASTAAVYVQNGVIRTASTSEIVQTSAEGFSNPQSQGPAYSSILCSKLRGNATNGANTGANTHDICVQF